MKILLVDDDPTIARMAVLALTKIAGHEVRTATGGEDALRQVLAGIPDLILLDVMMPGMGGPEVFRKLQDSESTRAIPVIFLSAVEEAGEIAKLRELGARGIIGKPFNPRGLCARIDEVLLGKP